MRVGVYIDGFNLYYGGRRLVGGRGVPGWRWLDLRSLATAVIEQRSGWPAATVERVVYCTARIDGEDSAGAQQDQDTYLRALATAEAVDHIEFGTYVPRVVTGPLAVRNPMGKPALATAGWPVMVQDSSGCRVEGRGSWCPSLDARRRARTSTSPHTCSWTSWNAGSMRWYSSATTVIWPTRFGNCGAGSRSGWSIPLASTALGGSVVPRPTVSAATGGIN
jgi:hypothetical protein